MIRRKTLERRISKALREGQNSRRVESVPFSDSSSIGLVYSEGTVAPEVLSEITSLLENKYRKDVSVLEFHPEGKSAAILPKESLGKRLALFKDDFSLMSRLINPHVGQFLQESFNYLICLDTKLSSYIRYVLAYSNSRLKVGYWQKDHERYLDFMISANGKDQMAFLQYFIEFSKRFICQHHTERELL